MFCWVNFVVVLGVVLGDFGVLCWVASECCTGWFLGIVLAAPMVLCSVVLGVGAVVFVYWAG